MTTLIDAHAGKLFVVDAHRSDTRGRFVVQSDELLTAFIELERGSRTAHPPNDFDRVSRRITLAQCLAGRAAIVNWRISANR